MTPPFTIPALDRALEPVLRAKLDGLAKPPGSLGRMEALSLQLGLIQQRLDPAVQRAILFVFAGDHGLTQEGVSNYPASVTIAMVQSFLAQRASANAFARATDTEVRVVDAGVAADLAPHPSLLDAKIAPGTNNAAREPAMTPAQCEAAIARGATIAADAAAEGFDVIALGEMGPCASQAIPQLKNELKTDQYPWVLEYVTNALNKIDPTVAPTVEIPTKANR